MRPAALLLCAALGLSACGAPSPQFQAINAQPNTSAPAGELVTFDVQQPTAAAPTGSFVQSDLPVQSAPSGGDIDYRARVLSQAYSEIVVPTDPRCQRGMGALQGGTRVCPGF